MKDWFAVGAARLFFGARRALSHPARSELTITPSSQHPPGTLSFFISSIPVRCYYICAFHAAFYFSFAPRQDKWGPCGVMIMLSFTQWRERAAASAPPSPLRQQPRRALLSPQISLYATRERFKIQAADAQENNNPRPSRRVASSCAARLIRVLFFYLCVCRTPFPWWASCDCKHTLGVACLSVSQTLPLSHFNENLI